MRVLAFFLISFFPLNLTAFSEWTEERVGSFVYIYDEYLDAPLFEELRGEGEEAKKWILSSLGGERVDEEIWVILARDLQRLPVEWIVVPEELEYVMGIAYPFPSPVMILKTDAIFVKKRVLTSFRHELSHLLLARLCGEEQHKKVPRWLDEGLAQYHSIEWGWADSLLLAWAFNSGNLLNLARIRGTWVRDKWKAQIAYVESHSFLLYLVDEYGEDSIRKIIGDVADRVDFDKSFIEITGKRVREVEKEWRRELVIRYRVLPGLWAAAVILLLVWPFVAWRRRRKRRAAASTPTSPPPGLP